jgi:hypothetical protein
MNMRAGIFVCGLALGWIVTSWIEKNPGDNRSEAPWETATPTSHEPLTSRQPIDRSLWAVRSVVSRAKTGTDGGAPVRADSDPKGPSQRHRAQITSGVSRAESGRDARHMARPAVRRLPEAQNQAGTSLEVEAVGEESRAVLARSAPALGQAPGRANLPGAQEHRNGSEERSLDWGGKGEHLAAGLPASRDWAEAPAEVVDPWALPRDASWARELRLLSDPWSAD